MMIHSHKNKATLLPRLLAEQKAVLAKHGGVTTYNALIMEMSLLENWHHGDPAPLPAAHRAHAQGPRLQELRHPEGRPRLHQRGGAEQAARRALRRPARVQPGPLRQAGLGRLRNLEQLRLDGCPGLAALRVLQEREGLPALLAHLL
jgi:hypothetical protein